LYFVITDLPSYKTPANAWGVKIFRLKKLTVSCIGKLIGSTIESLSVGQEIGMSVCGRA